MTLYIGLCGEAGAGKDTAGIILKDIFLKGKWMIICFYLQIIQLGRINQSLDIDCSFIMPNGSMGS